jgi:hypothetical protein
MDWTATGAPPPTGTFPTRIWRVIFLVIAAGSLMKTIACAYPAARSGVSGHNNR